MNQIFNQLMKIRKQLTIQQSSINECLAVIDELVFNHVQNASANSDKMLTTTNDPLNIKKMFPANVITKRAKLIHILKEAGRPMTAKEVKNTLFDTYGDNLSNVDQSLVNLEKDEKDISSDFENGRKRYFYIGKSK